MSTLDSAAQTVERVVCQLEDQWIDPRLPQSTYPSILGQGTERQDAPNASIKAWVCV